MQKTIVNQPLRIQVGEKLLTVQRKLGNGAFGTVYKVTDGTTSTEYALKDVLCLNSSQILSAISEIQTMKQISHEKVITVIEAALLRDSQGLHMLILTEYCAGGNLNERLARPSNDFENFKWMKQITTALSFLHSRGVVHCDLKPDNVLLTATENVKLADFGLAREYMALKRSDARRADNSWIKSYTQYYMTSVGGAPYWMAPEVFNGHYTEKADVFSLGVIFFAILERDFVVIDGKAYYGAFISVSGVGKVGLGYAMARYNPDINIQFSSQAEGSTTLQSLARTAMKYNKDDRPSAEACLGVFEAIIISIEEILKAYFKIILEGILSELQ